jgi:DNA-binding Lrp family transcriptional regulator
MVKIDLKDRKILYQLDLDCRQSNSQIGKKVGLKRDVVAYRIKRMEEERVIINYWTVIDAFKLGYNVFRIYLKFQDIPPDIKDKVINRFIENRDTWSVYSLIGPYDLGAIMWIKNILHFYQFYDQLLDNFGKYISKKIVSVYVKADEYERTYLISDKKNNERIKYTVVSDGSFIDIDDVDYKILNEIAVNARIPLIDLADKLKMSSQAVNYRLNNLTKSGVIKGFRITIDISKINLRYFDLRINLSDHSQRKSIIDFVKGSPYFKCLNTTIGYCDLEMEFHIPGMDSLNQILDEINEKYPGSIRESFYLRTRETHRERWLPEI